MKINNKRELQNIAIDHSADIDYKDFVKIYKEYTKEHFNFFIIDTKLDLEKTCFLFIKMTLINQIKILNRKIKQNEEQYDLDRKQLKYLHCLLRIWINMNI